MRLAFRVDASTEIGLGHVKRCLSLAQALTQGEASVEFVSRELGVPVADEVQTAGFACHRLPPPPAGFKADPVVPHAAWARIDWTVDARQTAQTLRERAIDWLVIDHYSFDARWHRAVMTELGCRIAVVDDLGDRELLADVLIDHNHAASHAEKYAGRISAGTHLLGGPRYALLGPAYAQAPRYGFQAEVRSIGIFTGGADAGNHSTLALRAVREELGFKGEVEIATTPSNSHLHALRAQAAGWPGTGVRVGLPQLSGFFARHDLHIGGGGGATWERCCIGAPTLAMVLADNQQHVLLPLQGLGVLRVVPEIPPTVHAIAREARDLIENTGLRARLAEQARSLVDGLGAMRVANHLLQACNP